MLSAHLAGPGHAAAQRSLAAFEAQMRAMGGHWAVGLEGPQCTIAWCLEYKAVFQRCVWHQAGLRWLVKDAVRSFLWKTLCRDATGS